MPGIRWHEAGGETLRDTALRGVDATHVLPVAGAGRGCDGDDRQPPRLVALAPAQWGVPMPFFIHRETGELHPRTLELLEAVAKRVEQGGIEAWFARRPGGLLGADAAQYDKVTGHARRLVRLGLDAPDRDGRARRARAPRRLALADTAFPADLYLEGSDQHRGWFQSSLLVRAC